MKLYKFPLAAGLLFSALANAGDLPSPIKNVDVYHTDSNYLSIQNLSIDTVKIDIYGEIFTVLPASGVSFECNSYYSLELLFKNNVHDFFEVPCQSRVVINERYQNKY
ncbi:MULTISPECIES: hypothetical protein [Pseudoalteromonas]|uniref:Orphan protein n=1 Tax=Pseudoalteromonas translucida (strain TAC 125) TaxID=326442 RepID=Q3IDB4_PSET1|nr:MULTISPECIES: hypothetical protein [Pseudoalteromonas]MBB1372169.1 hypothetical protein [Pseudoalteromonas sp. SR45-4]MBB1405168.1 hypothetical protein [Pseudoalteromonas sp. SG44-5]NYR13288.1 hypothetical protein [Pseudoalteromonas sp. MIP2626]CAI89300.1 putative orphan protein [Pseudoalteromonas translucida]